jgi:O-antigen chain-terminating methyltransferase
MPSENGAIGADELIRRARVEALRRQLDVENGHGNAAPRDAAVGWATVHQAIAEAERHALVGTELPPMHTMRGVRRRIAVPVAKLILRAARLVTAGQTSFNVESVGAVRALSDTVSGHLRTLSHRLAEASQHNESRVASVLTEQVRQRRTFEELLTEVEAAEAERRETAVAQGVAAARDDAAARIEAVTQQFTTEIARLRTVLSVQERRISILLEEARRASHSEDSGNGKAETEEIHHLLDAFYNSFEDHFRGSPDEIKRRAMPYLELIREAGAGSEEYPIVDLGCGRGEWLELLAESGLTARGADINRVTVQENRARGLHVTEGDALDYLRTLPDRSCGAVTGIHLLEHVPFVVMIRLFDETVRVLRPGGVAVFETPNPQNLLVGACRFYVDPTHRNPLHPDTMAFIAEARGLVRVGLLYLHPADEEAQFPDDGSVVMRRLNEYLRGPQDFAVIGYRP